MQRADQFSNGKDVFVPTKYIEPFGAVARMLIECGRYKNCEADKGETILAVGSSKS